MIEDQDKRFLPRAILAGAPKCGTTSVFDYLSLHPEICPSSEKETYYLMDEDYVLYRPDCSVHSDGDEGYKRFFSHCKISDSKIRFEATPDYLYQSTPLMVIPEWPVKPRVFFVLRRPEDRIYSLYSFAQNNVSVLDKRMTFREFIKSVESSSENLAGKLILSNAIEHSRYVNYLVKWRNDLGDENMKIFLFEDLVRDPPSFMKDVACFLGIDTSYFDNLDFSVSNKSVQIRSQWLHKRKRILAKYLPDSWRKLFARTYHQINIGAPISKTSEDREELLRIHEKFIPSNTQLEVEFALDLSSWKNR